MDDERGRSPDEPVPFDLDDTLFDPATVDLAERFPMTPQAQALARKLVDRMRTPLAPGDPRLHHYVPRWWLRRFADVDERLVAVELADLSSPRPPTKVDRIAAIHDFNTADDVDIGPSVVVERLLAEVDGEAAGPVDRLAHGVLFPPVPRDRAAIDTWLGFQFVRGPLHRRHHEAIADFAYKAELSLATDEDTANAYLASRGVEPTTKAIAELLDVVNHLDDIEVTPTHTSAVWSMLEMGLRLIPIFHARRLAVIKFDEPGLVIPDEPISLYQRPENRHPMTGVGVATADEVFVPLDRRTGLILHADERLGDRVLPAPEGHSIDDFNQQTVGRAFREIYCHPDDVDRLSSIDLPRGDRPIARVDGGWVKARVDGVNAPPDRVMPQRWRSNG